MNHEKDDIALETARKVIAEEKQARRQTQQTMQEQYTATAGMLKNVLRSYDGYQGLLFNDGGGPGECRLNWDEFGKPMFCRVYPIWDDPLQICIECYHDRPAENYYYVYATVENFVDVFREMLMYHIALFESTPHDNL